MSNRSNSASVTAIACTILSLGLLPRAADADSVEQFYRGKTIALEIPSAPGGINDLASRLVAKHLSRFIPGHPSIVPEDFPGASGAVMANRAFNTMERSGATIAFIDRAAPQLAIQGDPNAKFDPLKLNWLGSLSSYQNDAYVFFINSKAHVGSIADLSGRRTPIQIAAMTPGTTDYVFAYLIKDALKLNVTIVRGYTGAAPMFLAMQSGEVDGQVAGYDATKAGQPSLLKSKAILPLIQFGRSIRNPSLPDVPTGRELAPNDDARALIEFAELPFFMALPFTAPPGVPIDRLAALRSAFMEMTRDPEYLRDARKLSIDTSAVDHLAIETSLERAKATPHKVIEEYDSLLAE